MNHEGDNTAESDGDGDDGNDGNGGGRTSAFDETSEKATAVFEEEWTRIRSQMLDVGDVQTTKEVHAFAMGLNASVPGTNFPGGQTHPQDFFVHDVTMFDRKDFPASWTEQELRDNLVGPDFVTLSQRKPPGDNPHACLAVLHCVSEDGRSVSIIFTDYRPRLSYIVEGCNPSSLSAANNLLEKAKQLTSDDNLSVHTQRVKKLNGWDPDPNNPYTVRTHPAVHLEFSCFASAEMFKQRFRIKGVRTHCTLGGNRYVFVEYKTDPKTLFFQRCGITPCGWVRLRNIRMDTKKYTRSGFEGWASIKSLVAISDKDDIPPFGCVAFDCETLRRAHDSAMPNPRNPQDKTFIITFSFRRVGGGVDKIQNVVFCLAPSGEVPGAVVFSFVGEKAMYNAMRDLVVLSDCVLIAGYNTNGYDWPFLDTRQSLLRCPRFWCMSCFLCHPGNITKRTMQNAQMGQVETHVVTLPGLCVLDCMDEIKKTYSSLESFSAKNVALTFLQDGPPVQLVEREEGGEYVVRLDPCDLAAQEMFEREDDRIRSHREDVGVSSLMMPEVETDRHGVRALHDFCPALFPSAELPTDDGMWDNKTAKRLARLLMQSQSLSFARCGELDGGVRVLALVDTRQRTHFYIGASGEAALFEVPVSKTERDAGGCLCCCHLNKGGYVFDFSTIRCDITPASANGLRVVPIGGVPVPLRDGLAQTPSGGSEEAESMHLRRFTPRYVHEHASTRPGDYVCLIEVRGKDVAQHGMAIHASDQKVDLPYEKLFEIGRDALDGKGMLTAANIYGAKDAELVILLLFKLNIITSLIMMARVSHCTITIQVTGGQGIKAYCGICNYCHAKTPPYVLTTPDVCSDSFPGAIVMEPKPGLYTHPVVTMDFSSLCAHTPAPNTPPPPKKKAPLSLCPLHSCFRLQISFHNK